MVVFEHILHNGQRISKQQACCPIYTPTLTGALGVYETILVRQGIPIALTEHLERLDQSARGAQLALAADADILTQWVQQVIAANGPEGVIRLLVMDLGGETADIFIYQAAYPTPSAQAYQQGVWVILYHGERAMPMIKSFNTLVPGLARKAAHQAGAHDALLIDRNGYVTEGSNCNVFVVQDGVLAVPPMGVALEGTVMRRVMALAQELDIPITRRPLPAQEIPQWQEVFLTSTSRGVLPVRQVGEHVIGPPGPITRDLMAAYRQWEDGFLAHASLSEETK